MLKAESYSMIHLGMHTDNWRTLSGSMADAVASAKANQLEFIEFGVIDGKISIVDEMLTPDSSRFWPADQYVPGKSQPSFDKQFVRDYLEKVGWNKQPPGPELPADIVEATSAKYIEALRILRQQGGKLHSRKLRSFDEPPFR